MDGRVSRSDELPTEANWVLIYVRPDCRACEAIFNELGGRVTHGVPVSTDKARGLNKTDAAPRDQRRGSYFTRIQSAPRKIVVVVGGASVDQVKQMAAKSPWIPQGSWYADQSGELSAKLGLQGAPVIAGIKNGSVKWSYTGLPPQGMPLRSLMLAWHEQHDAQPAASPSPASLPHRPQSQSKKP